MSTTRNIAAGDLGTKNAPFVDVTHPDFGADKTGATDCSTAVQAAWDYIEAAGPEGTLYFPPGTYLFTTGIDISPPNNSKILVKGAGYDTIFVPNAAIDILTIDPGGSNFQQCIVEGIRFEMGSTYDAVAIRWNQVGQHGIIRDVWIDGDDAQTGGLIEFGTTGSSPGLVGMWVRDVRIRGGGAAAGIRFNEDIHTVTLDGVDITGCINAIDNDDGSTTASNINFLNCRIDNNTGAGIEILAAALFGLSIQGCRFEDNATFGIDLQGFDAGNNTMHAVNISSNYFTTIQSGRTAIRARRVNGLTLDSNFFRTSSTTSFSGSGLQLQSITNASLRNNSTVSTAPVPSAINGVSGIFVLNDLYATQESIDRPIVAQAFISNTTASPSLHTLAADDAVGWFGANGNVVFYYNDSGTTRYKWLDMISTTTLWTSSTTIPD